MSIGYAGNELPHKIQTEIVDAGVRHIKTQLYVESTKHCRVCGEEIPKQRLKIIRTSLCVECKEDDENLARKLIRKG